MKDKDFIIAQLALKAWQDGKDDGLNGMLAVAFVIRNRVRAGWFDGDWCQVLSNHRKWSAELTPYPDDIPDTRSYNFTLLLQQIDNIFSGAQVDNITFKPDGEWRSYGLPKPPVALYYAKRLDAITNPWFLENISRRGDIHQRVAQVGQMWFWS